MNKNGRNSSKYLTFAVAKTYFIGINKRKSEISQDGEILFSSLLFSSLLFSSLLFSSLLELTVLKNKIQFYSWRLNYFGRLAFVLVKKMVSNKNLNFSTGREIWRRI